MLEHDMAAPDSEFAPNPKAAAQLQQTLHRPPFDAAGKLVARMELRFGETVYPPGKDLPPLAELRPFGADERLLLVLYRNGMLDTYPRVVEEPRTATAKKRAK